MCSPCCLEAAIIILGVLSLMIEMYTYKESAHLFVDLFSSLHSMGDCSLRYCEWIVVRPCAI